MSLELNMYVLSILISKPFPRPARPFVKVRLLRRDLNNHNLSIFFSCWRSVRIASSFLNFELGMLSVEKCVVGALGITQMPELFRGNVKK